MASTSGVLGVCSDVGLRRELNEDSAVAMEIKIGPSRDKESIFLLAVADGMGGHMAGEIASRLAIESLVGTIASQLACTKPEKFDPVRMLDYSFSVANRVIYEHSQSSPETRGMGTTLTAAIAYKDSLYVGHAGDSRAYLVRGYMTRQLSRDHTLVQEKVDAGIISPEEAVHSEDFGKLTRALGVQSTVLCDIVTEDLYAGDHVILCTDGLHNSIHPNEIEQVALNLGDAQTICGHLVTEARLRDGSDNITAVCLTAGVRQCHDKQTIAVTPVERRSKRPIAGLLFIVAVSILAVIAMIIKQTSLRDTPSGAGPGKAAVTVTEKNTRKGSPRLKRPKAIRRSREKRTERTQPNGKPDLPPVKPSEGVTQVSSSTSSVTKSEPPAKPAADSSGARTESETDPGEDSIADSFRDISTDYLEQHKQKENMMTQILDWSGASNYSAGEGR